MTLDSRLLNERTATKSPSKVNGYLLLAKEGQANKSNCLSLNALFLAMFVIVIAGCGTLPKEVADAQSQSQSAGDRPTATPVNVAIARQGKLRAEPEYTGTTAPIQEISLRPQVEGRLLALNVDVGDRVKRGQAIAQLDDALLRTALNAEQAELAALKAEVARSLNQVSNVKAQVEQLRLELEQAQSDNDRQQKLLQEGAIAAQTAEQARTEAQTAAQALRASQEQVRTEQQTVAAAQERVSAQQALVTQAQEQLSYTKITSPISGVVTQRVTEEGNLIQPNGEIIRIGDFSRVQVDVEVSELALANLRVGQSVRVRLDAFPNQIYQGQVARISPAAEPTARLVPVEVNIPNSNGRIGSGLLARVSFENEASQRIIVPETAIQKTSNDVKTFPKTSNNVETLPETKNETFQETSNNPETGTIFVVNATTVTARTVTLGERANGNVEILSGLKPGERFVAQSGKPLKNGETVGISMISEQQEEK